MSSSSSFQGAIDLPSMPPAVLDRASTDWVRDSDRPTCRGCRKSFTFTRRRHHCRACGDVFCSTCRDASITLASAGKMAAQPACRGCAAVADALRSAERLVGPRQGSVEGWAKVRMALGTARMRDLGVRTREVADRLYDMVESQIRSLEVSARLLSQD
eukprot:CAMPEP_0174843130 /NCGR_PEP_ID=MMETSP1114-20130205/10325_1 /TAXON_ID=312471 /ORGANISM="Neobodo designis, Strain CCAP 1951/1" /LENGTH=157 /DNA_ID=CAMNT_0016077343 /DNA_START=24 /DNA_END=497 /DNA_ORIENTATION=+